jgi:hypothetical protein
MRAELVAGVLVTAVASVMVGCGGSAKSSGIGRAVSQTKGEKTATYSILYKEAGGPPTKGSGAVDFSSYQGRSILRFTRGRPYESIWDLSGIYSKTAGITLLRAGRRLASPRQHWVKAPAGLDFHLVGPLKMLDLSRAVDLLRVGDLRDVGRQRSLEHYKGSVAFDRFVKVFLPPSAGKPLLTGEHASVPVEAWVDSGNLVRRIAYQIPALQTDSPAAHATFDLRNFGKPVDVAPPPADDVIDVRLLDVGAK